MVCQNPPAVDLQPYYLITWVEGWGAQDQHYVALSIDDYEKLAVNVSGLRQIVEQLDAQVIYYQGCIERHNAD